MVNLFNPTEINIKKIKEWLICLIQLRLRLILKNQRMINIFKPAEINIKNHRMINIFNPTEINIKKTKNG